MKRAVVLVMLCALAPLVGLTIDAVVAPASAATPWCGGKTYVRPDGKKYVCRFDDDFNGSKLDRSKWSVQSTAVTGHTFGNDCWVDTPRNIQVSEGRLKLTSRKEAAHFKCVRKRGKFYTPYTSASVSTWGKFAQTYGLFAFRAKFPAAKVRGVHGALWLYPFAQTYGGWPASGEIDVAEFYSKNPDRAIPYVHYHRAVTNRSKLTNTKCMIKDPTNFHTYALEWTPYRITILYDGVKCMEHWIKAAPPRKFGEPFNQPFVLYISQVLGTGQNAFSARSTPLPATTEVDWVRVWR